MNRGRPLTEAERMRLDAFVAGAQAAVADWIGVEVFPTAEFAAQPDAWATGCLTAVLPLSSTEAPNAPARLVAALDADAAREFAQRAFAEVGLPTDPQIPGACLAELANLVAGRAKALTLGTPAHFLLGTPALGAPPPGEYVVAVLTGDFGELVVAVA